MASPSTAQLKEHAERLNTHFAHLLQASVESLSGVSAAGGSADEHAASLVAEAQQLEAHLVAMRRAGPSGAAEAAFGRSPGAGAVEAAVYVPLNDREALEAEVAALEAELVAKNTLIAKSAQRAAAWRSRLT